MFLNCKKNVSKNRTSQFPFLQGKSYLPILDMTLPIFERATQSELK